MTAEELLATMTEPLVEDDEYCTIDPETRVITIPPEYQLLGVESDEKAERLYFKCPKIVGDNIDLTTLALRVNFRNAGAVVDQYLVDDVEVDGDDITFSWLLSRRVTQYEGTVSFIVCAVKVSGEEITNEWNTTLAEAEVLEGLEVEVTLPEEETDIVSQLLALAETRLNDVRDATTEANTAASNANQKAQEAENAAEDARDVIEQITKDSYLHTALQSFIDTVTATPTAYGNAVVKKIEGFTRQQTTKGLNLMPLEPRETNATVIITDGGKTYRVTGKNAEGGSGYVWFIIPKDLSELKGRKIYVSDYDTVHFGNGSGAVSIFQATSSGVTDGIGGIQPNGFVTVPEQLREDTEFIVALLFAKSSAPVTTSDGNTFSNLWLSLDEPLETWEPYTGGQPAPNPDYPMVVQGNGNYGFWDGKFENGAYNSATGKPESGTNYIRCLNDITYSLKSGDEIKFTYEKPVNIGILLFDKQGALTYASSSKSAEWEYTVTKDQERFRFFVLDTDGVNTETAKHLTITINGKYALCVKSEGVNLCAYVESGAYIHSNGEPSSTGNYVRTNKMIVKPNTTYKESSIVDMDSVAKTVVFWDENGVFIKYQSVYSDIQTPSNCKYMALNYNADGLTVSKIRDVMITEKSVFPDTYIPYQSNVTYIPVDYPLFEGDKIVQRNGEYLLVRKWKQLVFDGSSDENWTLYSYQGNYNGVLISIADMKIGARQPFYCSRFRNIGMEDITGIWFGVNDNVLYVIFGDSNIATDVNSFKTWLQSNLMTIVYELATPTEEELSSEAQKALHSIMATDEQTELTIVGVPADAGIQNQFLLPRNEDGALNTTAYCTSVKNKLTLDELLSQSLDSRVNKLEIDNAALAEQTIVVE